MALLTCGLNHKTAPLSVREQFVIPPEDIATPLLDLIKRGVADEVVILSTCNRTEFYTASNSQMQMLDWLLTQPDINTEQIIPHLYFYQEEACVKHIMRVATGIDSMILGEPQILGQMKHAFKLANEVGSIGPNLQRLFQYVFNISKQIRTDTAVGAHPISVAFVAVNLAKRIFSNINQSSALLIGAGETIELAAKHLHDNNIKQLMIANRTQIKAKTIADRYHGTAITIEQIPTIIASADIIVTATRSPLPIIGKGMIERALKIRKHQPMLILDLAMPRDVEAEVSELSDAFLYCIDDLQSVIAENLADREQAAIQAEELINLQTAHFMCWLRSLDSVSLIREYRENCQKLRDKEIDKALLALNAGEPAEEVIAMLGRNLMNKFMHQPTTAIRQAPYDGDTEKLAIFKNNLLS